MTISLPLASVCMNWPRMGSDVADAFYVVVNVVSAVVAVEYLVPNQGRPTRAAAPGSEERGRWRKWWSDVDLDVVVVVVAFRRP